jgi:hypothetical protein
MKIFLSRLVLCALVLFGTGTSVWADYVRDSGVDVDRSTLTIEFDAVDLSAYSALENPPFGCFGKTVSDDEDSEPDTITISVSFEDAGVDAATLDSDIVF